MMSKGRTPRFPFKSCHASIRELENLPGALGMDDVGVVVNDGMERHHLWKVELRFVHVKRSRSFGFYTPRKDPVDDRSVDMRRRFT